MKVSYNWLQDYIEIKKTPEQLADDLSSFGFTVENLEKVGDDVVLDLEINPNRGDCLSVFGIAREIAGLYNVKIQNPPSGIQSKIHIKEEKLTKDIKVTFTEPKICPRYTARIIDNIEIKPSPEWLQKRLVAYGFRPINNIVDITNYVMVAYGQPLHAFDYTKIKGGEMEVTQAKGGEELITLDGKNHLLPKETIVIKDSEKIYDLAGIMGGIKSEIDENSKTIILQGAIFDPVLIRRASKKLAETTDASYRYERGVDYKGTIAGVDMAAGLIKVSCPEAKIGDLIDFQTQTKNEVIIDLDLERVSKFLGVSISKKEAEEFLSRLNFRSSVNGERLTVNIPSYRQYDVKIWQDLAEEIARVFGYDKITEEKLTVNKIVPFDKSWQKREIIKDELKKSGFSEIYSYSFIDKKQIELLDFKVEDCQEIANPLSPETQYLRPTLLSSLLTAMAKNPWAPENALFEIGKVFAKSSEQWQLGLATVGKSDDLLKKTQQLFGLDFEIFDISQKILDNYKIRRSVKVAIIDLAKVEVNEGVVESYLAENQYQPISKFSPTIRDLAFLVDSSIESEDIKKSILEAASDIFLTEKFDEYTSDKFGKGKKNVAFHIWFQDLKKPMADDEVDLIIKNIIQTIGNKFQAKLRS